MSKVMEIEAIDTLFFRDGKPFGESGDNWASSLTFPLPSTIYGAIKAIYFSQHPDKFKRFVEGEIEDPTSKLEIKKIYFTLNNNPYFIFPYDLVFENLGTKKKINISLLKLSSRIVSNLDNMDVLIYTGSKDVDRKDCLMVRSSFKNYLKGDVTKIKNFKFIEKVINKEFKIGIGREKNTKNVANGKLYNIGMNRFGNNKSIFKIVVEFDGVDVEERGIFRFGGEGKAASYRLVDNRLDLDNNFEIQNGDIIKFYLLTPAIFKNGWYPDFLDDDFRFKKDGIELKLKAAAIGKPIYVGGWDIDKPKRMYKAVPAGSVYYFEVLSGAEKVREKFNFRSIVGIDRLNKEGYGIIIIGKEKK